MRSLLLTSFTSPVLRRAKTGRGKDISTVGTDEAASAGAASGFTKAMNPSAPSRPSRAISSAVSSSGFMMMRMFHWHWRRFTYSRMPSSCFLPQEPADQSEMTTDFSPFDLFRGMG